MKYLVFLSILLLSSCSSVQYGHRSPANTDASSCHSAIKKIIVRNQEITIGETYVLGDVTVQTTEYISQGNVGYVYKAKVIEGGDHLRDKELVLKVEKEKSAAFALSNEGDLFYNVTQFRALKYLEEIDFPAVRVHESNFDHSVMLLDYVKGYDLKQYYDVFRIDQKFVNSLIELMYFIKELDAKKPEVQDVRLPNIMFDLNKEKWLIVDAVKESSDTYYEFITELKQDDRIQSSLDLITELSTRYPNATKEQLNNLVLERTKLENGKYHIYEYIFNGPLNEQDLRMKLYQNIRWKKFSDWEDDYIYKNNTMQVRSFLKDNEYERSDTNCSKLKAYKKLFKKTLNKSQKKSLEKRISILC